ncbi:MAG: class I SAM-dependent methyltransferase [Nitrospina sp.]|nr:class I SAM-dependent methyltransferase [Nitrospina sp.]
MNLKPMNIEVLGYKAMIPAEEHETFDATTEDYANTQMEANEEKTRNFILPYIVKNNARTVLDVGCGVGTMVQFLLREGFDAYGVDLASLTGYWHKQKLDANHFFVIDPMNFELPFLDDTFDFIFTLGVIEHIGTTNGHSDRHENYHEYRKKWLREVFRVVKPGGHMLIGGPNRNFPIDTAHGLDSRASTLEKKISSMAGVSIHKTWGENFLWSYQDFPVYLEGLDFRLKGQRVSGYGNYSRVPGLFRHLARWYVDYMPGFFLETGLNPWVMALIKKNK